ncbi:hypothetical protein D918_09706 [Trichuris suis]|nr:hypothetical protein D918_09706 [Trichuris suis]
MDSGDQAEMLTRQIVNHFYVDNWLVSFQSEAEAVQVAVKMKTALQRAGFRLAQWASSKAAVAVTEEPLTSVKMDLDSVPVERTLGLTWDPGKDGFILRFRVLPGGHTKREVLRTLATMFDPLRFFVPVTLLAKTIMQAIWKLKIGWDDFLPLAFMERWNQWSASCDEAPPMIIPRCILPTTRTSSVELHLFADASEVGYGAVAYLRLEEDCGRIAARKIV